MSLHLDLEKHKMSWWHICYHETWLKACGSGSGDAECERMLWATVQRLTREQLCMGLLELMCQLVDEVCLVMHASY